MGDESAMSGMSEMSGVDRSTAQAAGSGNQDRRSLILVVLLLVFLGLAGILLVAKVLASSETADQETEEDRPSDYTGHGGAGGNGGGVTTQLPDGPAPTQTTMAVMTTFTWKPRQRRPVMCTTRYPGPGNDPPKDLCDIVVYDAGKADFTSNPPQEVQFFIDYCKKGLATCGINIEFTDGMVDQLDTGESRKVQADFYAAGIKHYGKLRTLILTSTILDDIQWNVDLLARLERPMHLAGDDPDTLFWGMSPVLKGVNPPPDSMMKVFRDFIKQTHVNMLVYQTTFVENITGSCVSSGPSMWKTSLYERQITFVDALNFWKAVRKDPLPGVEELFTFTLCGYWAEYSPPGAQLKFNIGANCKRTKYDYIEDLVCQQLSTDNEVGVKGLEDELQYVSVDKSLEWSVGYDLNITFIQKVCLAKSGYGYGGGWVIHSLQCNFKHCAKARKGGGFYRIKILKQVMQGQLVVCDHFQLRRLK